MKMTNHWNQIIYRLWAPIYESTVDHFIDLSPDMLGILKSKADRQGRFALESTWTAWKDWEFGQKREPSRWLTLLAWRIIGNVQTSSWQFGIP